SLPLMQIGMADFVPGRAVIDATQRKGKHGIRLFIVSKPCSACSRVFNGDIYEDHAVSCAGIVGIKHRHNVERDSLVDICYCSEISAGKEVDIGLDEGLDVCVDLTGSSPLTQTGMADFVPGRAVIDTAKRKRGKYMAKCTAIGYGFLPFYFPSNELIL
ncbi:hypothetical protein Tco_0757614, partial [Tanacetum coccineum]